MIPAYIPKHMSPGKEHDLHDIPPPRDRPKTTVRLPTGMTADEFRGREAEFQVDLANLLESFRVATGREDIAPITPDDIGVRVVPRETP